MVLVIARIAASREPEADEILGVYFREIWQDPDKIDAVNLLFHTHPVLEAHYENGELLWDVVQYVIRSIDRQAVQLVPAVRFSIEQFIDREAGTWAYPFGPCHQDQEVATARVAVIGTGLLSPHPCLADRIATSLDFLGGDGVDRNGATSAQAMYLAQSGFGGPYAFDSYRVLDEVGNGPLEALKYALAAIVVTKPMSTMTHVQTDRFDRHVVGLAKRASQHSLITTTAPEPGFGSVFPYMVSEEIMIVR